jgi:hypothetical protein
LSDLTAEKWSELAAKLEGELAKAEESRRAAAKKANWLLLVTLILLVVTFGLAAAFQNTGWGPAAATPPGLLLMVTVAYVMRNRQLAKHAREDVDRIQRDIRQWKKKKPPQASRTSS